ncbi:serine hydrolase domain-containing protein [Streptomyces albicerus]|uniref:serine hydrolase domain-containing protein n=1 Tax=Streptomyces albicerus TaxID=2569859 RepID=UPI00124B35D7|nr:serine hydrolase domain-containing protein [Streptomyces albicerus]
MTSQSISRRSLARGSVAGAVLVAAGSAASRAAADSARREELDTGLDIGALQAAISDLSHPPATSAQLRAAHGTDHWYGTTGLADLTTGRAARPDDRFRAGSVTKAFVATVVLQLWTERRVELNAPIGRYLPGLLPSDFARITVTQLLNHTSGIPDHQGIPDTSTPEAALRHRFDRWTPHEWVRTVTHGPLKFRPGTKQEYRGINYVLLALLIEKLTGQRYGEAISCRVLRPLGLRRTLTPGDDPRLHGPHVHGYLRMTDGSLRDATVYNPSSTWGEGELVSTVDDLFSFQQALFSGDLLPRRAMDKLWTLPPAEVRMLKDGSPARYGMGLQTATVNGVTFWGKTGEVYGYRTRVFSTLDLRLRFVLSYTPTPLTTDEDMVNRVVAALTSYNS